MRLSNVAAALALLAAPAFAADGDKAKCNQKSPAVVAAITQYCNKLGSENKIPNRKFPGTCIALK